MSGKRDKKIRKEIRKKGTDMKRNIIRSLSELSFKYRVIVCLKIMRVMK